MEIKGFTVCIEIYKQTSIWRNQTTALLSCDSHGTAVYMLGSDPHFSVHYKKSFIYMTEYLAHIFKACAMVHVDTIYSETTNSNDVLPTCSYKQ